MFEYYAIMPDQSWLISRMIKTQQAVRIGEFIELDNTNSFLQITQIIHHEDGSTKIILEIVE